MFSCILADRSAGDDNPRQLFDILRKFKRKIGLLRKWVGFPASTSPRRRLLDAHVLALTALPRAHRLPVLSHPATP